MQAWDLEALIRPAIIGLMLVCVTSAAWTLVAGFRRVRRNREEARPEPAPVAERVPEPAPVAEPVPEPAAVAEAVPEPAAVAEAVPAPKPADLREGLSKSRSALVGRLGKLLRGRQQLDAKTLGEIEEVLFAADLGVRTADDLLEAARQACSPAEVRAALERRALEILCAVSSSDARTPVRPQIVLVVGVNGSGKTTSIGKLAARSISEGKRVLVAAADTFRAAAIDQLGIWAERAGADIVKGTPGGDPAAAAFDAVQAALAREIDVVLVDTAGRLQTKAGLMDELTKISRAVQKLVPEAPHEVLLVLDANTGQNAIRQAQEFSRAVNVTGILLAKLDGTAKGGVVLGIAQEVGVPVRYVGVGEGLQDLVDFDAEDFVRGLLAEDRQGETVQS